MVSEPEMTESGPDTQVLDNRHLEISLEFESTLKREVLSSQKVWLSLSELSIASQDLRAEGVRQCRKS